MKWLLIVFGLIVFVSCDNGVGRDSQSSVRNGLVEYNLGVVTNDTLLSEFKIRKEWANRKVKSISSACGCTVVELNKDAPLVEGKLFKVRVSLENKPPGIARQLFTIYFEDGFEFSAALIYNYLPAPFVTPKYVVLRKNDRRAVLELQFPGEFNVIVKKIRSPEFIKCTAKQDRLVPNKILLDVEHSESAMNRSEGTIICETSSARRPVFNVPVLVLEN
jgi:hypothetical protein